MSTSTDHHPFFVEASRSAILDEAPTVSVVTLTYDDIANLMALAPHFDPVPAYRTDTDDAAKPVLIEADSRPRPVFPLDAHQRPNRRAEPVGQRLSVRLRYTSGTTTDIHLFDTAEAERASAAGAQRDPARFRLALCLPAERPDDAEATVLSLEKMHGSTMRTFFTVAGALPADVETRMRRAIEAEFGDDLGVVVNVDARPASADRVDVFDSVTDKPLAVGILFDEVAGLPRRTGHALRTQRSVTADIIVGR